MAKIENVIKICIKYFLFAIIDPLTLYVIYKFWGSLRVIRYDFCPGIIEKI